MKKNRLIFSPTLESPPFDVSFCLLAPREKESTRKRREESSTSNVVPLFLNPPSSACPKKTTRGEEEEEEEEEATGEAAATLSFSHSNSSHHAWDGAHEVERRKSSSASGHEHKVTSDSLSPSGGKGFFSFFFPPLLFCWSRSKFSFFFHCSRWLLRSCHLFSFLFSSVSLQDGLPADCDPRDRRRRRRHHPAEPAGQRAAPGW